MKERLTRLILSTILLALSSLWLAAQEVVVPSEPTPPTPNKLNEVRLNLFAPIPYLAFSLEYERAVALDVGVGVMASTYFGTERANVDRRAERCLVGHRLRSWIQADHSKQLKRRGESASRT